MTIETLTTELPSLRNYVNYPSNVSRGSEFSEFPQQQQHYPPPVTSTSSVIDFHQHHQLQQHLQLPPPQLHYTSGLPPPLHRRLAAEDDGEEPIYVPGAYQVRGSCTFFGIFNQVF